ncbi:TRAP transporter small permease [Marinomonas primoryensis]|jgi:TRAP-type C4-dicarboxylate transport system permease small subunit|uniref:TRAP transporter small permease protein n=1 Tax=Marinomonas primoryensis TaxID=178399 RepID=A0A859D489_9GAMM|nr:TRAP transporter small permease [Marinomonas primoryensis]QKK81771.1 TRAP-type C4-dicarboxylate transport system small permease protein DctQ [Marinomonas primoryensis]|tara:strand:+ start:16735 stop:17271 length:537 start_codon:yes stop_codon:yes gene_type:complete
MQLSGWIDKHYPEPNIYRWIGLVLEGISAAVLLLLVLLTCFDVIGRYFFNNSIDGAVEITQLGLAVMVFAQMPVMTWRGGHVVVDLLDSVLGKRVIKVLGIFSVFIISTSFYFLAIRIYQLAERSLRRGEVTEYLGLPAGYIAEYIAFMSWLTAACMLTYGAYRVLTNKNDLSSQVGE